MRLEDYAVEFRMPRPTPMIRATLVSTKDPSQQFKVEFSLKVDYHLKRHPVTRVTSSTKTEVELTIKSVDGKPIPDDDYELHPEDRKDVIRVRKSGHKWTALSITFA